MSHPDDIAVAIAIGKENRELSMLLEHAIAELSKANVCLTPILEHWRLRRELGQQQHREDLKRRLSAVPVKPSQLELQRAAEAEVAAAAQSLVSSLRNRRGRV
jgi:hypothetical protein